MAFNRFILINSEWPGWRFFTNSDGCFAPLSVHGAVFRKLWQKKPACIKFQFDIQINFGFSFKFKLPNQFFSWAKGNNILASHKNQSIGSGDRRRGKGEKKEKKTWRCSEISLLKSGVFFSVIAEVAAPVSIETAPVQSVDPGSRFWLWAKINREKKRNPFPQENLDSNLFKDVL